MSKRSLLLIIITLLGLTPYYSFASDDGLHPVPGVIHLDSSISSAPLLPEEIVKRVNDAGLKVAIFSDKDTNKVEYGLFPLRNLLKISKELMSISRYGAGQYIEHINGMAQQHPDMVILPGTETTTFYYWDGSIWDSIRNGSIFSVDPGLKIKNFHKNILVIGLEKAGDYENLPSVSNKKPRSWSIACILNLWPLLLIVFGLKRFFYRKTYPYVVDIKSVKNAKKKVRVSSLIFTGLGVVFLISNFPFCNPKFDQYHGDKGSAPYQDLIDYVNSKGGLTFWSAPDVTTANYKMGPVTFETPPYYHELLNTRDYTGFAVFAEGMKNSGIPGGVWDQVLIEYINGKRKKPVWAIGELDYEEGDWMGETQTVFMVRDNTKEDILSSLRTGRVYAVIGNSKFTKPVLEQFQIWDELKQKWVEMGETAAVKGTTRIRIKLTIPPDTGGSHVLKVISEGEVVKSFNINGSLEETIEADYQKKDGMTYYRLDLDSRLISNPIFCDFRYAQNPI
ncbi:MAG: hypothetical protein HZB80_00510 [Deltaproteobacteria bacterium]|nr:hypothetical protein [Deltaproteobacteria bacterium]